MPITLYQNIVESLTPAVLEYANLSSVFELQGKIYVTFTQGDDKVFPLQFDSRSHVELWAQSCQRDPKLTAALFEKRMVK